MSLEQQPGSSSRDQWKERDTERRKQQHARKHPIPGMREWLDSHDKQKPEEPPMQ